MRVGVIEEGFPMTGNMGNDRTNITWINYSHSGQLSAHTTMVCGIIKRMAPDCSIYSYFSKGEATTIEDIIRLKSKRYHRQIPVQ